MTFFKSILCVKDFVQLVGLLTEQLTMRFYNSGFCQYFTKPLPLTLRKAVFTHSQKHVWVIEGKNI